LGGQNGKDETDEEPKDCFNPSGHQVDHVKDVIKHLTHKFLKPIRSHTLANVRHQGIVRLRDRSRKQLSSEQDEEGHHHDRCPEIDKTLVLASSGETHNTPGRIERKQNTVTEQNAPTDAESRLLEKMMERVHYFAILSGHPVTLPAPIVKRHHDKKV
jgi:hypothetical protein